MLHKKKLGEALALWWTFICTSAGAQEKLKISIGDTCHIHINEFVICRNCGDMGSGVCYGAGEKILYAWGRNAPKLKLPPGK